MKVQKLPEDRSMWIDVVAGRVGNFCDIQKRGGTLFEAVGRIIAAKKETTGSLVPIGAGLVHPIIDAYTTYCFMKGVPYNSDSDAFDEYWKENGLELKVIDAFTEAVGAGVSGLYYDGKWKNVPSENIFYDGSYFIQIPIVYDGDYYAHIIRFDNGVDHRVVSPDGVEHPSVFKALYPSATYGTTYPYKESPFVVFDFGKSLFADCIDWIQSYVFYCIIRNIEIENHALSKIVMDSDSSHALAEMSKNKKIADLSVLPTFPNTGVQTRYLEKSNNILQELRETINECMERLSFFTRVPISLISPSSVSGGKITAEATRASLDPFGRKVARYQLLSEEPISNIRKFFDGNELSFSWKNPIDVLGGQDNLELANWLQLGVVGKKFVQRKLFSDMTKEELEELNSEL